MFNNSFKILKLDNLEGLDLPQYAHEGDSGMDLRAAIYDPVVIQPRGWSLIKTGISLEIPTGYEAQLRSRSGLALKSGVFVLNGIGTIDSNYRGEVGAIIANFSNEPFIVNRGDKIAQLVFMKVEIIKIKAANTLSETSRGVNGFGSTGVKLKPSFAS